MHRFKKVEGMSPICESLLCKILDELVKPTAVFPAVEEQTILCKSAPYASLLTYSLRLSL